MKKIKITLEDLRSYPGEFDEDIHHEWVLQRLALRNFSKSLRELSEDEVQQLEDALDDLE